MPNPDKAESEVLDDEEAMEDVVDLLGAGLRDIELLQKTSYLNFNQ